MEFAALFDWDGVIIDSSRQHAKSWELLAKEENKILPPDHFKQGFGRKNEYIIPEILHWTSNKEEVNFLSLRKEALYREIIKKQKIEPLPGVRNFLHRLKQKKIPCAVGTSSHLENIKVVLELLQFEDFFQGIVTSEDVTKGKPNPEVFLKAAETIKVPPKKAVVFEDALVGIEAAHAGGMKAVAVTTTNPASQLQQADRVVDRLDELGIDDLKKLFHTK